MNLIPLFVINAVLVVIVILLSVAEYLLVRYGECNITINKTKILKVKGGSDLLGALSSYRIYIPSACGGKATCGYCKVQVLEGADTVLPTEEVFLTREQKREGYRLACQVKVKKDIEIHIPEYLLQAKEYITTVIEIFQLTHDIKGLKLKLEDPSEISFKPGQYIQYKVPGMEEFRAYSVASPPSQHNILDLMIRLVPGGICSTYIHRVLNTGDRATITGPFGDFFLREESNKGLICIGGGCGMAPIRSIIHHLIEQNMPKNVYFFFGARSKRDLFYTEELMEIQKKYHNFQYIPALSEPKQSDQWDGETGVITQVVERYIDSGANFEAYLCGPPPMIDAAIAVLKKKGIDEKEIHYDKF